MDTYTHTHLKLFFLLQKDHYSPDVDNTLKRKKTGIRENFCGRQGGVQEREWQDLRYSLEDGEVSIQ